MYSNVLLLDWLVDESQTKHHKIMSTISHVNIKTKQSKTKQLYHHEQNKIKRDLKHNRSPFEAGYKYDVMIAVGGGGANGLLHIFFLPVVYWHNHFISNEDSFEFRMSFQLSDHHFHQCLLFISFTLYGQLNKCITTNRKK